MASSDQRNNEENEWVRRVDRKCRELGYTRRPEQSTALLGSVPAAVIQEARDACPQGDARSLLTRVLVYAGIEGGDD